jgi:hypothetical protein
VKELQRSTVNRGSGLHGIYQGLIAPTVLLPCGLHITGYEGADFDYNKTREFYAYGTLFAAKCFIVGYG